MRCGEPVPVQCRLWFIGEFKGLADPTLGRKLRALDTKSFLCFETTKEVLEKEKMRLKAEEEKTTIKTTKTRKKATQARNGGMETQRSRKKRGGNLPTTTTTTKAKKQAAHEDGRPAARAKPTRQTN